MNLDTNSPIIIKRSPEKTKTNAVKKSKSNEQKDSERQDYKSHSLQSILFLALAAFVELVTDEEKKCKNR